MRGHGARDRWRGRERLARVERAQVSGESGDELTNRAWKSVDRHRRPPKKTPPASRGRLRRKGCAVTALAVGAATWSVIATWKGLT